MKVIEIAAEWEKIGLQYAQAVTDLHRTFVRLAAVEMSLNIIAEVLCEEVKPPVLQSFKRFPSSEFFRHPTFVQHELGDWVEEANIEYLNIVRGLDVDPPQEELN